MIEYKKIEEEYLPTPNDDDYMLALKEAIFSGLTPQEVHLLIYYSEIGSYAGLARFFRNSTPTARKRIKEIRERILKIMQEKNYV